MFDRHWELVNWMLFSNRSYKNTSSANSLNKAKLLTIQWRAFHWVKNEPLSAKHAISTCVFKLKSIVLLVKESWMASIYVMVTCGHLRGKVRNHLSSFHFWTHCQNYSEHKLQVYQQLWFFLKSLWPQNWSLQFKLSIMLPNWCVKVITRMV